jgi:small GTP-binding protein
MGENMDSTYAKTIGVDFAVKRTLRGGFQIWDIAGESTPNTVLSHLRGTSGIILVFDVMASDTLSKLHDWINITTTTLGSKIDIALVANKIDLRTEKEGLTASDVMQFVSELKNRIEGNVSYFETSALTGDGVDDVFSWLLKRLTQRSTDE